MNEQSTTLIELAKALSIFQGKVKPVKKDSSNPFFKSKYASLDNILDNVKPILSECGLSLTQFPSGDNSLTSILLHSSGEWIKATAKIYPKDSTPQSQGSAITYMRRYAMSAILGIATEEDDDGNASSQQPIINKDLGQGSCTKCGAGLAISKTTNKPYCSAKCWLTKESHPNAKPWPPKQVEPQAETPTEYQPF